MINYEIEMDQIQLLKSEWTNGNKRILLTIVQNTCYKVIYENKSYHYSFNLEANIQIFWCEI